jgi:glycosyltransferase involved in cell wall biosynthesis
LAHQNANDLITIVVPVYNAAEYLRRCLKSLLNQTYKHFELILINDGSTDESGAICEEFASLDLRIKISTQPNRGVCASRNKGISMARGRYIVFCDSDDAVNPDYLLELHKMAKTREGFLPVCHIRILGDDHDAPQKALEKYVFVSDFPLLLEKNLFSSVCNKMYSIDIIKEFNLKFDESCPAGEDTLFNIDYIKHIKGFSIANESLYYYYLKEEEGLHSLYDVKRLEAVKVIYKKLESLAAQLGSSDKMKFYIRKNALEEWIFVIWQYALYGEESIYTKYKTLKKILSIPEYFEISAEMDYISIPSKRRKVMQTKSGVLILLYCKLLKLKLKLKSLGRSRK